MDKFRLHRFVVGLLLVAALGRLQDACPKECKCARDVFGHAALYCEHIAFDNLTIAASSSFTNLTVYGATTEFDPRSVLSLVDLQVLVMDNVGLTSISTTSSGGGESLQSLRTLSLNNNRLLRLTMYAFAWCLGLRELSLAGNGIKALHADVFVALDVLETLNLANNNLQSLDFKLMKSLVTLDLSNNEISKVARVGPDLPNLRTLRLCGNQLESVSELDNVAARRTSSLCVGDAVAEFNSRSFGGMPDIVQLELVGKTALSENAISALTVLQRLRVLTLSFYRLDGNLSGDAFEGFDELLELHLNNMESTGGFDKDVFAPLTKLGLLDLRGSPDMAVSFLKTGHLNLPASLRAVSLRETKLSAIETLTNLENLTSLDLSENPLRCEGTLRDLIKLLLRRPVVLVRSNETLCSQPDDLQGKELLSVDVVASILLQEPSTSNGSSPANATDIEALLKRSGVSVDCLFYVAAGTTVATITLLVVVLALCICLAIGRSSGGGRRQGKDDVMEGFVRADNEYTFDNFTLSETLAECRRLNNSRPLHSHSPKEQVPAREPSFVPN